MGIVLRTIFVTLTVSLTFSPSWAASLKASCQLQDAANEKIEGVNIDERYPIASVSKIVTSYWAISKMGVDGRFQTLVSLRKLSGDSYDVHLSGSRDPYFGKWALQFLVSELNRLGVRRIRTLSFDQRFKFLIDTTSNSIATLHIGNSYPSSSQVADELEKAFAGIRNNYSGLRSQAAARGVNMPESIQISVENIQYVSKDDFSAKRFDTTYSYRSAVMIDILKEMNRNSNNYAANNVFESLGGSEKFKTFIKERLGMDKSSIRFVNGSGDRKDTDGGPIYNEATCRSVIRVIQTLRKDLKANGKGLQSVLAVAGQAPAGQRSTVDSLYMNDVTDGALIAKTGTVNPAITLAGMLSTEEGNVYFGYIYKTNGGADEWRTARQKIKVAVTQLIQNFGGPAPIDTNPRSFLAFDKGSRLTAVGSLP